MWLDCETASGGRGAHRAIDLVAPARHTGIPAPNAAAGIGLDSVTLDLPARRANGRSRVIRAAHGGLVVRALDDVTLNLAHGDRLGIVGGSAAGRSMLLRVLAGTIEPTSGRIWRRGRMALLADVALEGGAPGFEAILARGLHLGLHPDEVRARMSEIVEFAEFDSSLALPADEYSGAMRERLGFAVGTCLVPDILIVDRCGRFRRPSFRKKARLRLRAIAERAAIVVLASDAAGKLEQLCTTGALLRDGRIEAHGPIRDVLRERATRGRTIVPGLSRALSAHGERDDTAPPVSVVMAVREEQAQAVDAALRSALGQDYDGAIEVVVADASIVPDPSPSTRDPRVRIIGNPRRWAAAGLNRAIRAASHDILVRCDAGCVLPADYVRRAVATLRRTGAANVGGRQWVVGSTFFERSVALAMTTPLGAGRARYRIGGPEGPVDTVFLGAFRREPLERVGGYDETLARNQDYELNWRLALSGEKVWFDPALRAIYRPQGSVRTLARQYFDYGRWKRRVISRDPASARPRQLLPPALVLGLAASLGLSALGLAGASFDGPVLLAAGVVPGCYGLALLAGAIAVGLRRRSAAAAALPVALATMHLAWGVGFLLGPPSRSRLSSAPDPDTHGASRSER